MLRQNPGRALLHSRAIICCQVFEAICSISSVVTRRRVLRLRRQRLWRTTGANMTCSSDASPRQQVRRPSKGRCSLLSTNQKVRLSAFSNEQLLPPAALYSLPVAGSGRMAAKLSRVWRRNRLQRRSGRARSRRPAIGQRRAPATPRDLGECWDCAGCNLERRGVACGRPESVRRQVRQA